MNSQLLSKDLNINLMEFREQTAHSSDFIEHRLFANGVDCALILCDGMVKQELLAEFLAEPLADGTSCFGS